MEIGLHIGGSRRLSCHELQDLQIPLFWLNLHVFRLYPTDDQIPILSWSGFL